MSVHYLYWRRKKRIRMRKTERKNKCIEFERKEAVCDVWCSLGNSVIGLRNLLQVPPSSLQHFEKARKWALSVHYELSIPVRKTYYFHFGVGLSFSYLIVTDTWEVEFEQEGSLVGMDMVRVELAGRTKCWLQSTLIAIVSILENLSQRVLRVVPLNF